MASKVTISGIRDEIAETRNKYPKLRDDSAFVLWFMRAYLTDSEEAALNALVGDTGDKGIDAILVDAEVKQVHVIQGKFRQLLGKHSEKRNDVLGFSDIGTLPWKTKDVLEQFCSNLNPPARKKCEELLRHVRQDRYHLRLYYVTTGRCSKTVCNEAIERVRNAEGLVEMFIFDADQVVTIFRDYLEGVAPAVPSLSLRIASEGSMLTKGAIHRFDPATQIESWVFSMSAKDVGGMYQKAGIRLFARNIRGYLGQSNEINEAMAETIRRQPQNFWYFNNGVTIVCDEARLETQRGEDVLRVERPQVINGQQTTRTLFNTPCGKSSMHAGVLVRVIKIPRNMGDDDQYDDLVRSIVRATNWQNAIKAYDLVSNDSIQVFLERELRKHQYQYLRKRQTKSEAKSLFASQGFYQIKKEEMAQAIAACEFDPSLVRKGKEILFGERYYRSLFGSRLVPFYLSRYWLMRQVQSAAHGYPDRAYAKWLVLHFVWEKIAQHIESGNGERRFRYACERSTKAKETRDVLSPLQKALVGTFRAALAFHRSEVGRGEEAKDVSSFFRLTKLDQKLKKFWHSDANSQRKKVEGSLRKFVSALTSVESGTVG